MSRVGLKPISLPAKVSVKVDSGKVQVEGPKGTLDLTLPDGITIKSDDSSVVVARATEGRTHRALHGTVRSLVNNMITGVSQGFVKDLEIQGVGLRAAVKGKDLDLSLGKSHPILHPIPAGLTVTVYAHGIDDAAGRTLASASTLDKSVENAASNVDCAAKVGALVAERAKAANVSAVVFDRGGHLYHGKIKALAEAAREAGLQF